jgi:hypothetical protein
MTSSEEFYRIKRLPPYLFEEVDAQRESDAVAEKRRLTITFIRR